MPLGRPGVHAPTGVGQQLGPARPRLVGQPQVAAGVDAHTHLGLGQGEDGVLGGDPDVGHEHQLETEAEAVSLDGGHHRLGQLGEDLEALVGPADALVVIPRLLGRGPPGDPVLGHPQVDAGAEGPTLAPQHHGPHPLVEADLVGPGAQLAGRLPTPGVELLRVVEGEDGDVVFDLEIEVPLILGHDGRGPEHFSQLRSGAATSCTTPGLTSGQYSMAPDRLPCVVPVLRAGVLSGGIRCAPRRTGRPDATAGRRRLSGRPGRARPCPG